MAGGNSVDLTPADTNDCNGTPAQQWTLEDDGSLHALGKCLDVFGGGTTEGTRVELYTCNGAGHQRRWSSGGGEALVNPQSGLCLDDPASSTTDGTQLDLWDCTGNPNQSWTLP